MNRKDSYFPPERYALNGGELAAAAGRRLALAPRRWRAELPHLIAVFAVAFALYAYTAPRHIALEDDALFTGALHFWGVSHPPGYPIHTFLGGIFYRLMPFGSPAFKAHLFSGFAAAAACAALYAVVCMLLAGRVFSYLAALSYAVSKTFWSQAIIAEVYTLNAFFFFTALALALAVAAEPRRRRRFYILAAVCGCGLANHYPLLALGAVGLGVFLFLPLMRRPARAFFGGAVALAAAAPFYIWMVWRSRSDAAYNFYGAIDSGEMFRFYVLREGYAGVDKQAGVDLADKIFFAEHLAADILWQFTPPGFLFAAAGCAVMLRSRYSWLCVSLLAAFLTNTLALLLLLDFEKDYLAVSVFSVYPLLAYGVMAVWLACGAAWTVDLLRRFTKWHRALAAALAAAIVAACAAAHWADNNRRDYRWARDLALTKLNSVEKNAVLFTYDDLDLPVSYLHYVEGKRPDISVYDVKGLVFPNRLFSPLLPETAPLDHPSAPNQTAALRQFVLGERRPVYYHPTRRQNFALPRYGVESVGFYHRVRRDDAVDRIILRREAKEWLAANLADERPRMRDRWTRRQQYETIAVLLNDVQLSALQDADALDDEWRDILRRGRAQNGKARALTNLIKLEAMTRDELRREAEWLDGFDPDDEPEMDKFGRGRVYLLRARLAEKLDGAASPAFEKSLLRALAEDERANNPGVGWLMNFYAGQGGRECDYIRLAGRYYPDIAAIPDGVLRQIREVRARAGACF